jgi:hypothetical protein
MVTIVTDILPYKRKGPALWRGTIRSKRQTPELAMGLLLLLTRLLLAAALLLLTGLLVGVLLARIWGLIAHSGSPLLNTSPGQPERRQLVSREQRFPEKNICRRPGLRVAGGTGRYMGKISLFIGLRARLPRGVPTVKRQLRMRRLRLPGGPRRIGF